MLWRPKVLRQGWIQHDLVGGGGGALPAQVPSCVSHVCRPPINLLHYCKVLLDYCIWIVIVVHSSLIIMFLLKLLYLILPLIIFCLSWKIAPPWPALGGCSPPRTPPPPPPSKSIPVLRHFKRRAGRYLHTMYKFSEAKVISVFGLFIRNMISIIYFLLSS